ncbi:MAG TPA: YIP1 family protein [Planctomycetota bacterium]|nr:YIP1 family protein [Planctomycetota bacterium]
MVRTTTPGLGLRPDTAPLDKPCPQCGKPVMADALKCRHCGIAIGDGPGGSGSAHRNGPDWERRDQLGWVGAITGTVKGVLLDPVKTFEKMGQYGYGPAIGYTALLGGIGMAASALWQLLFSGMQMSLSPRGSQAAEAAVMTGVYVVMIVLAPGLAVLGAFVTSALVHLGLMIVGGAKQPFETTFRTVAYAAGSANVFNLVPVCGGLIAGIWALVAEIIGIAKTHEISYGKAALGVLLLPVGLGLLCGCAILVIVFGAMGAAMH